MGMKSADLVEYGIGQDTSDYRLHICPGTGYAYLYATADMQPLLASACYPVLRAYQKGVDDPTSFGYNVPVEDIPGLGEIPIPSDLLARLDVNRDSLPDKKGRRIEQLARAMFRRGLLPLPLDARIVSDGTLQRRGGDLEVSVHAIVQVKCDWMGGRGGFGCLFVQTHERNPLKRRC